MNTGVKFKLRSHPLKVLFQQFIHTILHKLFLLLSLYKPFPLEMLQLGLAQLVLLQQLLRNSISPTRFNLHLKSK